MSPRVSRFLPELSAGEYPPEEFLEELGRILNYCLQNKGFAHLPPKELGYPDRKRWREPGALEDLRIDVYVDAILPRLPRLLIRLRRKSDGVDGLLVSVVCKYLIDRSRRENPGKHRLFKNAQGAAQVCVERGTWETAELNPRSQTVRTDARLHRPDHSDALPCTPEDLGGYLRLVSGYQDLLPFIRVLSVSTQEMLADVLDGLHPGEPVAFRLQNLAANLEGDAGSVPMSAGIPFEDITDSLDSEDTDTRTGPKTMAEDLRRLSREFNLEGLKIEDFERRMRMYREAVAAAGHGPEVTQHLLTILQTMAEAVRHERDMARPSEIADQLGLSRPKVSTYRKYLRRALRDFDPNNPEPDSFMNE